MLVKIVPVGIDPWAFWRRGHRSEQYRRPPFCVRRRDA